MKASSKKTGGPAKKMATGGAPNANGYGKKAVYASSIGARVAVSNAKQKSAGKTSTTKPSSTKKKVSKKQSKAMTDDEFDGYMKKKYGTMTKKEFGEKTKGSTIVADTENPSNVGKKRTSSGRIPSDPVVMVKNDTVKIPTTTSPDIKHTALVPVGKKGGAMSKMKKMSYRKGGSKKRC